MQVHYCVSDSTRPMPRGPLLVRCRTRCCPLTLLVHSPSGSRSPIPCPFLTDCPKGTIRPDVTFLLLVAILGFVLLSCVAAWLVQRQARATDPVTAPGTSAEPVDNSSEYDRLHEIEMQQQRGVLCDIGSTNAFELEQPGEPVSPSSKGAADDWWAELADSVQPVSVGFRQMRLALKSGLVACANPHQQRSGQRTCTDIQHIGSAGGQHIEHSILHIAAQRSVGDGGRCACS